MKNILSNLIFYVFVVFSGAVFLVAIVTAIVWFTDSYNDTGLIISIAGTLGFMYGLVKARRKKKMGRIDKAERAQKVEDKNVHQYNHQTNVDIARVDSMDGHEFEYFCAEVLRKNGFKDVKVTKGSGDQGVDILAKKSGKKYAIQCKNYSSKLGNKPIQEVNTGKTIYKCDVGVVMTNSDFTQGAIDAARATKVLLWDRTELVRMMQAM